MGFLIETIMYVVIIKPTNKIPTQSLSTRFDRKFRNTKDYHIINAS